MKRLVLLFAVLFFQFGSLFAQVKTLKLNSEKFTHQPKGYIIVNLVDNREDTTFIGKLSENGKVFKIYCQGFLSEALFKKIDYPKEENKKSVPVTLQLAKLECTGKKVGGLWQVNLLLTCNFVFEDEKLFEFTLKSKGTNLQNPNDFIEKFLTNALETNLKQFEEWLAANKENIVLTKNVKVELSIGTTIEKENCIVYSSKYKLNFSNFKATPPENTQGMAALTYSGAALNYNTKIVDNQLVVYLTITPYFDETKSWFVPTLKTLPILAHEQLHFDICAVNTCRLVEEIKSTPFFKDKYAEQLERIRKKNATSTFDEEDLYDAETNHGIISEKQIEWSNKIRSQLQAVKCY